MDERLAKGLYGSTLESSISPFPRRLLVQFSQRRSDTYFTWGLELRGWLLVRPMYPRRAKNCRYKNQGPKEETLAKMITREGAPVLAPCAIILAEELPHTG